MSKVRYYRMKKGFTQKELSERTKIPISTIRSYEQHNRRPSKLITIIKLAEALEIDINKLI